MDRKKIQKKTTEKSGKKDRNKNNKNIDKGQKNNSKKTEKLLKRPPKTTHALSMHARVWRLGAG